MVAAEPADLTFDAALLVSALDAWLAVKGADAVVGSKDDPPGRFHPLGVKPSTWATAAFRLS